ncbi:MAG: PKD domain-containing protein [Thermoplasmata archaeon]|nr:PKD domain-containing protein [Thermoplasmata archaeon]
MGERLPRVAVWGFVVLVLAGVLASVPGALATSTPTYSLLGSVEQPTGIPVVSGVAVDLISGATHQVYTTATLPGGQFNFSSGTNAGALQPGWWGVWVPPQAHVKLTGSSSTYAILPSSQNPAYAYENATELTTTNSPLTVSGVSEALYNSVLWGNATYNGRPVGGASVQLLDPTFNGAVFANNTTVATATNTTVVGEYSLSVPEGTWVLETTVPGSPSYVNYTQITVSTPILTVNPVLGSASSYLTWGFSNQAAHPASHIPAGGNVTLFDPTNDYIYSAATPAGGFYEVGSYPAGFVGPGVQTFDVILSHVGYATTWYTLNVSGTSRGGPNPHNVLTPKIAPPAAYTTVLNFQKGFNKVVVTSNATLANDTTFPELANASVGQLWAQLALDWQSNTTFSMANFPTFLTWLNSSGPFFPAGQAGLTVNGTGFGQPTNYTFTNSTTCASFCGLGSNASIALHYSQTYNTTSKVGTNLRAYSLSFNFRHPTHAQTFNYTVELPAGYVLSASSVTSPPAQSWIRPTGPGGTYTSFTLVSNASTNPSGTASLTIVKSGNVTANVNVTVANFTFSSSNVLNDSTNNYTVIVGTGENVTFSAANSTFPAQTSGVQYAWVFGDGGLSSKTTPTTNHTYATAGVYTGSVKVTGSGGQSNSTKFTVYASSEAPTAVISVNSTVQNKGGENYTIVNWSSTLQFNASTSVLPLTGAPGGVHGVLSVALFNVTAFKSSWLKNLSASAGANASGNDALTFLGGGHYLTAGYGALSVVSFQGWQYNVSLTIWDAAGHSSTATMVVLVRDTEKPSPVARVLNSAGKSITSIVEAANHTAFVSLSATNSSDPHNGSITWFNWSVTNSGNSSANQTIPIQEKTLGSVPANKPLWLTPQSKPYTVNLTVTDRAGNTAYTTISLTVAVNTSTRPVLEVGNMTTSSTSLTDGKSYTVWVNVTNTIGKNSTAENVAVLFYLLPPSGSGTEIGLGGSPGTVQWFGYTNGTVNTTSAGTGTISIPWNHTMRAQVSFTPARIGNYDLWANATATNEFAANYAAGGNQAHVAITISANPIVNDEIYAGILIAAVAVILAVYFLVWRPRTSGGGSSKSSSGGKSGLERGGSKKDKAADDDEDDS